MWLSHTRLSPLFSEGFKEAADKFGAETGICYPYDSESLNERIKIRESIENGQIERAISHINNLHPELVDNNRLLAFHLRVRASSVGAVDLEILLTSLLHLSCFSNSS